MLKDTDPMPFGLHKGTPMQDVPPRYLHWFYTNNKPTNQHGRDVFEYIETSIYALKMEEPDLIWIPKK